MKKNFFLFLTISMIFLFIIYHIVFFLKDTDVRADKLLAEAYKLRSINANANAIEKLKKASGYCTDGCWPETHRQIVVQLADLYNISGNKNAAIETYSDFLHNSKNVKGELRLEALNNRGFLYRSINKPQEAIRNFDEAIQIALEDKVNYISYLANAYTGKVLVYIDSRKADLAEKEVENLLKIQTKIEDKKLSGKINFILGEYYRSKGVLNKSIASFTKALDLIKDFADTEQLIRFNFEIANTFQRLEDKNNQIKYYGETIHLIEKNRVTEQYLDLLTNSAMQLLKIFQERGDKKNSDYFREVSIKYFTLLTEKYSENFDKNSLSHLYNEMARLHFYEKKAEELVKCIQASISLSVAAGNKQEEAHSYMILGEYYHRNRNFRDSEKNYLSAKNLFDSIKDSSQLPVVYFNLGILYRDFDERDKALECLREAKKITLLNNSSAVYIDEEIKRINGE